MKNSIAEVKTSIAEVTAYRTKDGSEIRELMHPAQHHGALRQSLAEARVAPGERTAPHRHLQTEELYYFLAGEGAMTLGAETFAVTAGDTVRIAPGVAHSVRNTGRVPLRILCSCVPPYSHEDTLLL